MTDTLEFLLAVAKAVDENEHNFTCPICGAVAHWERARSNGHLHAKCDGCRTRIME